MEPVRAPLTRMQIILMCGGFAIAMLAAGAGVLLTLGVIP